MATIPMSVGDVPAGWVKLNSDIPNTPFLSTDSFLIESPKNFWRAKKEPEFEVGERVRYWSDTHKVWMDTIVHEITCDENNHAVMYNLGVKKAADSSKIQRFETAESAAKIKELLENEEVQFEVGESVEYWSDTNKKWMQASVQEIHITRGNLTYDLDVKPYANPSKIRKPLPNPNVSVPPQTEAEAACKVLTMELSNEAACEVADNGAEQADFAMHVRMTMKWADVQPEGRADEAGSECASVTSRATTADALAAAVPHWITMAVPKLPLTELPLTASIRQQSPAMVQDATSEPFMASIRQQPPAMKQDATSEHTVTESTTPVHPLQVLSARPGTGLRRCFTDADSFPIDVAATKRMCYERVNSPSISYDAAVPATQLVTAPQRPVLHQTNNTPLIGTRPKPVLQSPLLQTPPQRPVLQTPCLQTPSQRPVLQTSRSPKTSRSIAAPADPQGPCQSPLTVEDLQIGAGKFDPRQPHILSQLAAKLGLSSAPSVEALGGFTGGRNEGIWILTGARSEKYVLKLISCHRCYHSVPTETEQFMKLSKDFPGLSQDREMTYPVKIFACQNPGPRRYDVIVMKPAAGTRLAEVMHSKWAMRQIPDIMKIMRCVGACLKRYHMHYHNVQHTDFQPANIFWDDATQAVTVIDLGGMGGPAMHSDNEHFKQAVTMMTQPWGAVNQEACRAFDAGYNEGSLGSSCF